MKSRTFGKTDRNVSEIGIGTWSFGGMWGPRDDRTSVDALNLAIDSGVTFIDTAFVYGKGHSETIIGNVLTQRKCRDDLFIATKIPPKDCTWPTHETDKADSIFPAKWIREITETSLKNLKTDCIDLQQFHRWEPGWLNDGEWLSEIEKLKKEGKIKYFGVSINDHKPDSALELVKSGLIDSVQVIYNIFDQSPEDNLLPLCQKHNVAVIVRVPFDEGGLTGKLTPDMTFHKKDWRARYFSGDRLSETCAKADALNEFLNDDTSTISELALKYCLANPAVTTVIPGMRKQEHVKLNCAVSDTPALTADQISKLHTHRWVRNFYGA